MNFTIEALIRILVVVVVVMITFWLLGTILIGIPSAIIGIIKIIVPLAALAAVLKILGIV